MSKCLNASKLDGTTDEKAATAQLEGCLRSHRFDYFDLMLVHAPIGTCAEMQAVWRAVEQFYQAGKARSIGISNFAPVHVADERPMGPWPEIPSRGIARL